MDVLTNLYHGLQVASTPEALLFCFIGVTLGTFVGVLPGIGAMAAISMCLPLTFYLEPTVALIMLSGIYYGSQYGGSTAAILMNIPGSSTAAITCLDGYPLAMQGKAGKALFVTSISSFVGGTLAIVLLILFAPALAQIALRFNSAEYFSVMLLALVACAASGGGSLVKGMLMMVVGLVLGLVGTDVTTGTYRLTFGILELADGLDLIAVAIGLFGIAEILSSIKLQHTPVVDPKSVKFRNMLPTAEEARQSVMPTLRGFMTGSALGVLPGAGPTIATFMAYSVEKRIAKDPSRFGKGAFEGLASPESANNAAVQTAFIPTLSLGLPGDAVMAILLGAMLLHGITPGPQFINQNPEMFWGLIASFWIGNILLLVLNIPLIGVWVRMLTIPYHLLYPAMLFFICIGVYSVSNSVFDVFVAIVFGLIGLAMNHLKFPIIPLLLGFILGPMLEENFRRAMLVSGGDISAFVQRPISLVFLVMTVGLLFWPLVRRLVSRRASARRAI